MSTSTTSLAERVTAPAALSLPTSIAGLSFRPLEQRDLEAVHQLIVAAAAVDAPTWRPSRGEIAHWFSTSGVDPQRDGLVGVDAGGHVMAAALDLAVPGRETMLRVLLLGAVHPDVRGQGIGRRVLAWQLGRGRQLLAASELTVPGMLELAAAEGSGPLRLAARAGLVPLRYWLELERDLADPIPERAVPDGFVLRPSVESDVEAIRIARNDAFRDHWGSQSTPAEDWARRFHEDTFRFDLSYVVVDGSGVVVAFSVTEVDPDAFAARGGSHAYVDYVGVVRDHRGRGLAPLVLGATMRAAQRAGLDHVVLDVDAENPSGALGLYERMGFVRARTTVSHAALF
ncbi:GNAT family N-acetyltransferase [Curtobacterium sp. MCBD17_035]|uniref:GNAT family N-acetyltransferase n=1 Tax=Curtobacterium sp. MCBD17_035 TaxID=2175673 RepID=UPI000DA94BC2|nr:GNAT family N-acetyltransferase [Curtobacterium sp. MCBD17_035]WIB67685.1 GNAT family N-acetyltransferase [Curtobacterium sp. MCBD17_035]